MIRRGVDVALAWLTERPHATRGLSVTRIVLGFIVSTQLMLNWSDRSYTWGDGARWTEPIRETKSWPAFFGLFLESRGFVFDLLYVATILFALMLMAGLWTRGSAAMTLLLWMSLYVSNPFVGSGGDAILRMVLLYACFTDMSRHLSVDALLRARRGEVRAWFPSWLTSCLHNVGVVLIVHQVITVYVGSAFWKVQSPLWRDGTATYFPLETQAYSPWVDWIHPLTSSAPIIHLATWSAIYIQLLFPVALLYRPTRALALVLVTGMHLGIGVLMGIMYFSLVMIAVDMMLISDGTWRSLGRMARTRLHRSQQRDAMHAHS